MLCVYAPCLPHLYRACACVSGVARATVLPSLSRVPGGGASKGRKPAGIVISSSYARVSSGVSARRGFVCCMVVRRCVYVRVSALGTAVGSPWFVYS